MRVLLIIGSFCLGAALSISLQDQNQTWLNLHQEGTLRVPTQSEFLGTVTEATPQYVIMNIGRHTESDRPMLMKFSLTDGTEYFLETRLVKDGAITAEVHNQPDPYRLRPGEAAYITIDRSAPGILSARFVKKVILHETL